MESFILNSIEPKHYFRGPTDHHYNSNCSVVEFGMYLDEYDIELYVKLELIIEEDEFVAGYMSFQEREQTIDAFPLDATGEVRWMKNFIEKLSRETGKLEKYELIELTEEVKIKKEIFEITHKYYKRLSDDELFEPFEDPDYNLNIDYNTYRNKHNLLYSEDIKEIRNMYKLFMARYKYRQLQRKNTQCCNWLKA